MIEFKIETSREHTDQLAALLELLEAIAITCVDAEDQPIYEPLPGEIIYWPKIKLVALFEDNAQVEEIDQFLAKKLREHIITHYVYEHIEQKDEKHWISASMDLFKPMRFGKRLMICPSWECVKEPAQVIVSLDPGLSFGTGNHATTHMCLEWLDENIQGGEHIIDYGCGSGILAIAALKLGAKRAHAIDHDPQSLIATNTNAEKNTVAKKIETYLPQDFTTPQADILIANILAQPLISLAPKLKSMLHRNGKIALSGILYEQCDNVIAAYAKHFDITMTKRIDEWVLLSGILQ